MKNAKRRRLLAMANGEKPGEKSVTIPEKPPTFLSWKWLLGSLIVSLAVSFFLYGNILHGQFVYDDLYFANRQDLRQPSSLVQVWHQPFYPQNTVSGGGFYRPLWTASLALNFILFGADPFSFHMVNTILYGLILFLLFIVIYRLSGKTALASTTAALFAFLPVHTEAVANIKSRDELLSAVFILAAWYLFLRATDTGNRVKYRELLLSGGSFFLAILSKENVVFMPLFFVLSGLMTAGPSLKKAFLFSVPFVLAYIIYLPLRINALGSYAFFKDNAYYVLQPLMTVPFLTRFSTGLELLYLYVAKTFVPAGLSASYDFAVLPILSNPFASWMAIAGIMIFVAVLGLAVWRRTPAFVRTGILFFLISYLVISKLFFPKGALFGERLIFLPSIGLSMVGGWLITQIFRRNVAAGAVLSGLILIVYTAVIWPRNLVWSEPMEFFQQMVRDAPRSVQARSALARGYFDMGRLSDSYEQAQAGYAIYPKHPPLLNVLGKLEFIRGDYRKAAAYLKDAAMLEPQSYDSNRFYALTLIKLKRYAEGIDYVREQLKKHPADSDARFVMAVALYRLGNRKEAMSDKYIWTNELDREAREQLLRTF